MSYQKYNTSQYPRRRGDKYHAPLRYRDQSPPGDAHHAPSWASSDYIAEPVYSDSDDYITPKQQQQQQQQPPPPPRQSNLDHYRTAFRRARYEDSSMTSSSSPMQNGEKPCPSSSPYQPGYHPRWPARPRYRSPSPGSDYIAEPVRTEDDYIATPPAKRMPGAFVDEDDTPDFRNGFSDSGLDSSPPQRAVSVPRSISRRRALSKQARVSPERSPSRKRSISRPPPKAEEKPPVPDVPGVPDVTPPSPKPLQRPISRRRRWDAPASPPRSSSVKDDKPEAPEDTPPSAKPLQRPVSRPKRWDAPVSPRRPSPRRRSPRRRSLKPYELENLREAQEFLERFRAIEKKLLQPEPGESKPAQPKRWDAPASPPRRSPKPHELEHLKEAQEFLRRFRARNRGRDPTPPPPEPPQPQPQAAQPNRWDHAPLPPRRRSLKPHEQENLREAQEFLKRFRAMEKTLSKPKPPQPKALQPEAPQPQPDSPSRWDHAPLPPRRRSLKPHELDNFQEAREFLERFRALDVQHKQRSKSQSSEEYHSEDSDNESGGYHRHDSPERRNMRYFPSRQSRRDIYEAGFSHPPTIKRYGPAYSDTASYRSASLSGGASRTGSTARSYISRSPISRRPRLLRVRDRSYDSGRSRSVPARLRIKDGHGSDTDDNGLGEGSDYLPSDESDSGGKPRRRVRRARFSDEEDEDDDYEDEYEHDRRYRHGGGAAARRAYSDDDNGVGEGSDYLSSDEDEEDDYEYDHRRAPVREERRGGGGGGGGGGFLGYRTTIHRGYRPPEQLRYGY